MSKHRELPALRIKLHTFTNWFRVTLSLFTQNTTRLDFTLHLFTISLERRCPWWAWTWSRGSASSCPWRHWWKCSTGSWEQQSGGLGSDWTGDHESAHASATLDRGPLIKKNVLTDVRSVRSAWNVFWNNQAGNLVCSHGFMSIDNFCFIISTKE